MSYRNAKTITQPVSGSAVLLAVILVAAAALLSACASSPSSSSPPYAVGYGVTETSPYFNDPNFTGRRFYGFRPGR